MGEIDKYSLWIRLHFPTESVAKSVKSLEAVDLMQKYFPELIKVSGEIEVEGYLKFPIVKIKHCWLKDELGSIIDPTYAQFGDKKVRYKEDKIPLTCYSCGKLPRAKGSNFCSTNCENKFISYLGNFVIKKSL